MTEIRLIEVQEQPTVGIRRVVRMTQLSTFFDDVFPEVFDALREAGTEPAGAPYARYRGPIAETVDVEGGFPVSEPIATAGELVAGSLPAARVAEAVHTGHYDNLPATYTEVRAWLSEQGLTGLDDVWEVYEAGPDSDPDPATWRTRIHWPVSGPQVAAG